MKEVQRAVVERAERLTRERIAPRAGEYDAAEPEAPLRRAGNFSAIHHYVGSHRIRKTAVAAIDDRGPGVNDTGYRG